MSEVRGTVVLDWDGICEDSYDQRPDLGPRYDFKGIDEAHRRGYAVAISTCNDTGLIARVLKEHGHTSVPVPVHRSCYWYDPDLILVTNVKIHGWFVDDRSVMRGPASPWQFPVDWREVFGQIEIMEMRPERYREAW